MPATHTHATTQAAYSGRVARSALALGLGRFSNDDVVRLHARSVLHSA